MLGKVLFIAPYKGLATLATRMARQRDDMDITVRMADLEQALPLLDWARGKGIDLIISRGGTASFLEHHGSLPVVEIAVSGYDLFRLTSFIKDYQGQVSLIGFPNVCAGVATFSDYLDVTVPYTVVHGPDDVDQHILRARDDGRVVIGDTVTIRKAEEAGVKGLLITSGPESVETAFDMAANLLRGMGRMRTRQNVVEHCLNSLGKGVVLSDGDGAQIALSQASSMGSREAAWQERLLPFFAHRPALPEGPYVLRSAPLSGEESGLAVLAPMVDQSRYLLFHDADVVGSRPATVHLIHSPPASLDQLAVDQRHLSAPAQAARKILQTRGAVAVVGAPGTGRTRMIRAVQTALFGPEFLLLCGIDIHQSTRESLRLCLDTIQAASGLSVHLQHVERLRMSDQDSLARDIATNGHGVILVFSQPVAQLVAQGLVSRKLADVVADREVCLPAIKDDLAAFEATVLYLVMEANAVHGKQLRGVSKQVMDDLLQRSLPGNYEDLAHFIDRLVHDAPDGLGVITQLPSSFAALPEKTESGLCVDTTQTLDQMEDMILRAVLDEEGGNRSAAAARLGIGRSTLWRKLQCSNLSRNET